MNIATLEQVQNRLIQLEGSFSRLLNHLPGMAYRCHVSGDYSYSLEFVSKGSVTLLGVTPEAIVANSTNVIERMMLAEDLPNVRSVIYDSVVACKAYQVFYRVVLGGGELKWIWDQGEGVYDSNGLCISIEGIMMDITEQKNNEQALWEENHQLRSSIKNSYGLGQIVGKSEAMQNVYSLMLKAAKSDTNVILYGETGVGKDLAARTIHELHGTKGRYVPVNCAAIPEQLLESEFFGHVKGAFSGATSNHAGHLAAANDGTLFLDEIAELPLKLQVKLLRAIESKTYTPVGSSEVKRSNFRLISATNQNLQEMVRQRAMRADFYYRIHVLAIHLPALRTRQGDLPLLIDAYARDRGITDNIPASIRLAMEQYAWPGNVRELQNALDRYWAFGDAGIDFLAGGDAPRIEGDFCGMGLGYDFPLAAGSAVPGVGGGIYPAEGARLPAQASQARQPLVGTDGRASLTLARDELENTRIRAMLECCSWRRGKTAEALGITLRTLQRKMKKYDINR